MGRFRDTGTCSRLAKVHGNGFRAGADVQFLVDMADVGVDRGVGQARLVRDFLVEKPLGEESEHFGLAR